MWHWTHRRVWFSEKALFDQLRVHSFNESWYFRRFPRNFLDFCSERDSFNWPRGDAFRAVCLRLDIHLNRRHSRFSFRYVQHQDVLRRGLGLFWHCTSVLLAVDSVIAGSFGKTAWTVLALFNTPSRFFCSLAIASRACCLRRILLVLFNSLVVCINKVVSFSEFFRSLLPVVQPYGVDYLSTWLVVQTLFAFSSIQNLEIYFSLLAWG